MSATDAAGNESPVANLALDVDTVAPARARVVLTPPSGLLAHTTIAIKGEPTAHYAVHVAKRAGGAAVTALTRQGELDADGAATVPLLAANGAYLVTVLLSDAAQNSSPAVSELLNVALAPPSLVLTRASEPNSREVQIAVTGPATGTGAITFTADGPAAVTAPFTLDSTGKGVAIAQLPDDRWNAAATVKDFQGRHASATLPNVLVDTVAPVLEVNLDRRAAEHAKVLATFAVETGSKVTVNGMPGGERTFAVAGPTTLQQRVDDGSYHLRFRAVDLAGNETLLELDASIDHPLTVAEALTVIAVLAILGSGPFLGLRTLWRRRFDLQAKRLTAQLTREHGRAVAAHQAALAAHMQATADHVRDHVAWVAQGVFLLGLMSEARTYDGSALDLPLGTKPRPGELLFSHIEHGALVEVRRPNGTDVVSLIEAGEIWVTNHRVLFAGSKRREWNFDKLVQVTHLGSDATMMLVSNRQKPSGISYAGTHHAAVRRHFDLARATFNGKREDLVIAAEANVASHLRQEPRPPGAPPAAPLPPALPTAEQLRAAAEARKPAAVPAGM